MQLIRTLRFQEAREVDRCAGYGSTPEGLKKGRGCASYTAVPCRIDRRVPSRDRNSGGGSGFSPLISGCNARCLTLIFYRPVLALLYHSPFRPSASLSFSPVLNIALCLSLSLSLVSPSYSPLSRRGLLSFLLTRPFVSPPALYSPLLALRFPPLPPPPRSSSYRSELAQAATNLAPPNEMCQGLAR